MSNDYPNNSHTHDASSKRVESNQHGLHKQLRQTVEKHLQHTFQRPIADHNKLAFDNIQAWINERDRPFIIDSYCGVGESTLRIAKQHPETLVIGIDKSSYRLNKHENIFSAGAADNYQLVRADVDDFWRLAQQAGWQPIKHFLLYPNPWPKSVHLKRRCHGSPLFPTLLALGGALTLRSNWSTYLEEFNTALIIAGHPEGEIENLSITEPMTPFERKYSQSGQTIWQLHCHI